MERQVIFRNNMDADPQDFNDLQDFTRTSLDHLTGDAVTRERKFAGFDGTKQGAADVVLAAGRLFSAGEVYVADAVTLMSFVADLPLSSRRHVLVYVYAGNTELDARPREFLLDEDTGASEARTVPMQSARVANVNFRLGSESPDPVDPALDAELLAIARIVLVPTGVDQVVMIEENRLPSVGSLDARVGALQKFADDSAPQIVALGGDIASLKAGQAGLVAKETYGRGIARLAVIEAQLGIPSNAADSSADFFLDGRKSDPTFLGYNARVSEGIRFAPEASGSKALALFDLNNPRAKLAGSLLFPAYTLETRLSVGPITGELQAASFSYQTNEMVQLSMSRTRLRYGEEFTICTNSAWWASGAYDSATQIFAKDGETFEQVGADIQWADGHAVNKRFRRVWQDTVEEPYWSKTTIDHAVPGAQVAETFLMANAGWLGAITLYFTKLAQLGSVVVSICETERGMPNLDRVLGQVTMDRAQLAIGATRVPFEPVWLDGGKRYALVVTTAADHWLATTQGVNFPTGTLFTVLDGAYQQGDGTRDLVFDLLMLKFAAARAVIELEPQQLAGGIAAIDILADSIVPASCDLTYEVQVAGVWKPLSPDDASVLGQAGSLQPLLPLRAIYTGTPDAMPAVRLTGSRITVLRPRTTLTWVGKTRTLPGAGSTQIRVACRLEYFDPVHHTAVAKLRTGAAFATAVSASAVADRIADDGSIERTWVFNLGAAVTAFRLQVEATTDSASRPFHVGWEKDWAL